MQAVSLVSSEPSHAGAAWTPDGFIARAWHALDMALQPIVLVRSGRVYGYEALMRGHDHLGLGSIRAVLDMACDLGVADLLHVILLEKSLKTLAGLGEPRDRKLFFNLDGRALRGGTVLHAETGRLLEKYGIAPSALCLEFSETFDYASAAEVAEMVAGHREMGIRFAIDDFGRGFSELKVLYEYHPEFIKIDRFFVTGLVNDSRKRLFVSTVVNLAHVLGVRVVVEGIETEREYELCWQLGCDLAQGYFVAPPRLEFPEGHVECPHLRLAGRKGRQTEEVGSLVHDRIERLAPLAEDATMAEVFEAFRFSQDQTVLPILDRAGEAKGIIRELDLKEFTYSPYGRDLLSNSHFRRTIADFIRPCPIADVNSGADEILDIFAYHNNSDGILITENSRYLGFLSAPSLLEIINDKRLEVARDQNPLSKLPGNASITRYSEELAENTDYDRFLCYVDFDNFKPFNDSYSFREGDGAIIIFSDLLRRQFRDSRFMIGHVGGDDFFVGGCGIPEAELVKSLSTLRERFAKSAESLYCAEDRRRGHIEAVDRYGKRRRFPLLSCSIAILKIPAGQPVACIDTLLYEIARTKRQAKEAPDGLARAEHRDLRPFKAGVACDAPL